MTPQKRLVLLLALLATSACTIPPRVVYVTWEELKTTEDIARTCGPTNQACSKFNLNNNTCTIYTISFVRNTILGHELCHCFKGQTHGNILDTSRNFRERLEELTMCRMQ